MPGVTRWWGLLNATVDHVPGHLTRTKSCLELIPVTMYLGIYVPPTHRRGYVRRDGTVVSPSNTTGHYSPGHSATGRWRKWEPEVKCDYLRSQCLLWYSPRHLSCPSMRRHATVNAHARPVRTASIAATATVRRNQNVARTTSIAASRRRGHIAITRITQVSGI
jgi:hypothetical protein